MRLESLLKFRHSGDATTAEVRVGRQVVCIDVSYEDGSRATVVLDHAEMDQLAEAWLARQTAGTPSRQEAPATAGASEAGVAQR
jgi:hypothetical protein